MLPHPEVQPLLPGLVGRDTIRNHNRGLRVFREDEFVDPVEQWPVLRRYGVDVPLSGIVNWHVSPAAAPTRAAQ